MADAIVEMVRGLMGSPWVYLALFAFAAVDAFFPVVPSEGLVITAGVFAAHGKPSIALVILAAGAGAVVGDHVSYTIGRTAGSRVRNRLAGGKKSNAAFAWADKTLAQRGGLILIVARYIPGGRTAVTLTAGTVRYPLRTFTIFDVIAGLSWGTYCGLIGFFGGKAFEEDPIKALLLGLGIAGAVTIVVELVRHYIARRRRSSASSNEQSHRARVIRG